MIIPEFLGRTGNLLFQIAACIGYAKQHSVAWQIPKFYKHKPIYNYWNLPLYQGNPRKLYTYDRATCDEDSAYQEIPFHPSDFKIRGFFQSYRYFENAMPEVKEAFRLRIEPQDYVSIHVRRGDYLEHANAFPPVDMNYISQAVRIMNDYGKNRFLVFSDDMQWCQQNMHSIEGQEFMFTYGGNEFQDLSMMASCTDHIIANSSFSYWGAMLGHNHNKIVVSPSHEVNNWFGNPNLNTKDLLPKEWVQIKFR